MALTKRLFNPVSAWVALTILVAAVVFSGCVSTPEEEKGLEDVFFSAEGEVLSHTGPQDGAPGILVVRASAYTCMDKDLEFVRNTAFAYSHVDSSEYAITGGRLYVWPKGTCWARAYNGGSNTLHGKWTLTTVNRERIPAAYRSEYCEGQYSSCENNLNCPDDYDGDETSYKSLKAITTISSAQIQSNVSGGYCLARIYTTDLSYDYSALELVEVLEADCDSARIRNRKTNKVAVFSSSVTSDGNGTWARMVAVFDTTTCRLNTYLGTVEDKAQCPDPGQIKTFSQFQNCVSQAGLYQQ